MGKYPKLVISISGLLHIGVGLLLLKSWPVVVLGAIYSILFLGKDIPLIRDNLNRLKLLSILTLILSFFGVLSNFQYSPSFMSYLVLFLLAIPVGTSFLSSIKELNIYSIYKGVIALLFVDQLESITNNNEIIWAFITSIGFIYFISRHRIKLEENEKNQRKELKNLIENFPDTLIKKIGHSFQVINNSEFKVSKKCLDIFEKMENENLASLEDQEIDNKYYDIKMTQELGETVFFLRDITEKHQHLHEIEEGRLKLVSNSQLASLGEMAGGIAHEINNPLQILSLYNEQMRIYLMNDDINPSKEEMEKICDQSESTIERINNIIKGMKIISRDGNQDNFERFNLKDLVNETLGFCNEKFKNNGVQVYLYEEECQGLYINAQRVKLSQVILNILNNAFDAISSNGSKIVRITLDKDQDKGIVRLSISDNGPGVPESLIQKVFQPFFTTKDVGKGTGLGLSISKGVIEEHHGNFYIDPNERSRFVIEIPESAGVQNA